MEESTTVKASKKRGRNTGWQDWLMEAGIMVLQTAVTGVVFGAAQSAGSRAFERTPRALAHEDLPKDVIPLKRANLS